MTSSNTGSSSGRRRPENVQLELTLSLDDNTSNVHSMRNPVDVFFPRSTSRQTSSQQERRHHYSTATTTTTSSDRSSGNNDNNSRRTRSIAMISVDACRLQTAKRFVDCVVEGADYLLTLLAKSHIPEQKLQLMSLLAVAFHVLHRDGFSLVQSIAEVECIAELDWDYWVGFAWVVVPVAALLIAVCFAACVGRHHPSEAALITGIVSLILVELMLPLSGFLCLSLFLAQSISGLDAIAVVGAVWVGAMITSQFIRRFLQISVGHD